MNTVEVNSLSFAYSGGTTVLRDVSFNVSEGEVFVIAGLSGCGKTTLCNILCGIIPHAIKGELNGYVSVMDIDPTRTGLPQIALRVGMVYQDADDQLICTTVEDELAFGPENLCMPPRDIRRVVDGTLLEFGLEALRLNNPNLLSGGEKKLLTIASVLTLSPPVLVLDEPMSGLDLDGRAMVLSAIMQQKRIGRTVIVVEHDLKSATYADRWLILHDGAVRVCDTPASILSQEYLLKEMRLMP